MVKLQGGYLTSEFENNHPQVSVIPCTISHVVANARQLPRRDDLLAAQLLKRWDACEVVLEDNCRNALRHILDRLEIKDVADEVSVFTTSGMPYLSGCVSRTIELRGSWRRETVTSKTRAILVVHEFGYPFTSLSHLKEYGVPIIEDVAFAFDSRYPEGNLVGTLGDYVVCSFSKFFDIQFGGAAVRRTLRSPCLNPQNRCDTVNYISNVVGSQYDQIPTYSKLRLSLLDCYTKSFARLGCRPYFSSVHGAVPGVFLFNAPPNWNLPHLKEYLWRRGIQCTVFYGEQAFYLPLHHNLSEGIVDYLYNLVASFTHEGK